MLPDTLDSHSAISCQLFVMRLFMRTVGLWIRENVVVPYTPIFVIQEDTSFYKVLDVCPNGIETIFARHLC